MQDDNDKGNSVRIKIRGAEFEATGSEQSVNARFEAFMKLATALSQQPVPEEPVVRAAPAAPEGAGPAAGNGLVPPPPPAPAAAPDEALDTLRRRAFRVQGDVLSLLVTPRGESLDLDAIILILYGRHVLMSEPHTMVGALIDGLKQSGLPAERIASVVAGNEILVNKGGVKRGTRYVLTNRGMQRAEEALKALLS